MATHTQKKALRAVRDLVIYVAVLVLLVVAVPPLLSKALDTPYPMAAITSGSMWPALKEGDLVFIRGVSESGVEAGDIIVFQNKASETLTIHRVVKLTPDGLVTKGDANFGEDEEIRFDDIVGKAVTLGGKTLRLPYLGAVTVFARSVR